MGLVAGILGSMFGLGGGFLMVPLLTFLGSDIRVSIGTSATAIFFNSLSATISYSRSKLVIYRAGLIIALIAILGAYLGARATKLVDTSTLRILFGSALILVSVRMIYDTFKKRALQEQKIRWGTKTYIELLLGGFLSGLVAGLLGVGGGVINVPLLSYLGFTIHQAVATSSMAITITTVSSAATHYLIGNVNLYLATLLTPTLIIGAQIGSAIAKRTSSKKLRIGFSILLVLIALRMILETISI
ncbi:MAG: sulfite exporter TauE/SafE family protein [Sulfolobales archaeon]